jgi:small subunit ribosomal protein S1
MKKDAFFATVQELSARNVTKLLKALHGDKMDIIDVMNTLRDEKELEKKVKDLKKRDGMTDLVHFFESELLGSMREKYRQFVIGLRAKLGKSILFKVLNYDRAEGIFTASREAALEQVAAITLKKIEVDQVIIAVVRHVSQTLVRADIGGIEVKMPVEDISYGWIDDLTEKVKIGNHLKVKVQEIDKEHQKVKVSAKEVAGNPWPSCAGRYQKGNEYVGTVSGVREYGVFVNLEPGVDCLSRHLKFQDVDKGDRVLVRVLETDARKEQIRSRITRVL